MGLSVRGERRPAAARRRRRTSGRTRRWAARRRTSSRMWQHADAPAADKAARGVDQGRGRREERKRAGEGERRRRRGVGSARQRAAPSAALRQRQRAGLRQQRRTAGMRGGDARRRRAAAVVAASAGSGAVTAVARLRRMFDNAMDSNGFEGYGEATVVGCRVRISGRVRDISERQLRLLEATTADQWQTRGLGAARSADQAGCGKTRTLQRRTRRLAEWTKAADGEKKGREPERESGSRDAAAKVGSQDGNASCASAAKASSRQCAAPAEAKKRRQDAWHDARRRARAAEDGGRQPRSCGDRGGATSTNVRQRDGFKWF
ncbi:hypothetical protein Scep_001583 [Stephania cephalantha]|uniref:Uncharacterized protein n=1 Tax=Stephania cephalantha TaxID=152367 RepID=A0AAP0L885_9MAGN